MDELKQRIKVFVSELEETINRLDIPKKSDEMAALREEMASSDFWQDNNKAQKVAKREADLTRQLDPWLKLKALSDDLKDLAELGDESITLEIGTQLDDAERIYAGLMRELRFQQPYDDHDVILSIYAGAGGTDAQDWAQMLLRMYVRWAESHHLKVKMVEESAGEEAGIKSATLEISGGNYLYGKLRGENGVHRLVRLSPFNSAASRETSFAKVEILPAIDKPDEVQLDDKDLKIDVFRAGGHGGQSVNTTDSAVRVTHVPTGITVAIQNERSQLQNKETALTILRSKLARLQLEQHAETLADVKGPNQSAEFGNQIRNYVLHPYKQVKDLRSGYETSDAEKVLDGHLDPLIESLIENP